MRKERIARIAAVVACTALIAGVTVTQAVANLPDCSNCIESSDIAAGAVRASELNNDLDDSITANDLAASAVGKTELAANAVGTSELLAAASAAVATIAVAGNTTGTGTETIETFTVTVPGPGYLRLTLDGTLWMNLDATTTASELEFATIGLCTATDSISGSDCGNPQSWSFQDADNATGTNHTPAVSLTRTVQVASAGTHTYYINADVAASTLDLWDAQVTALFAPDTLTIATP